MKIARINATFPDLKGSGCYGYAEGRGSSASVAIGRAFDRLLSLPHVKGKHIEAIKATIGVATLTESNAASE